MNRQLEPLSASQTGQGKKRVMRHASRLRTSRSMLPFRSSSATPSSAAATASIAGPGQVPGGRHHVRLREHERRDLNFQRTSLKRLSGSSRALGMHEAQPLFPFSPGPASPIASLPQHTNWNTENTNAVREAPALTGGGLSTRATPGLSPIIGAYRKLSPAVRLRSGSPEPATLR